MSFSALISATLPLPLENQLAGAAASATGATFVGITASLAAPTANLGGYATAQIVASSTIGVGGPALSTAIAAIGGPIVAGLVVCGAVYGVFWGLGRLVRALRT